MGFRSATLPRLIRIVVRDLLKRLAGEIFCILRSASAIPGTTEEELDREGYRCFAS
jgi:hypothetical protein